MKRGSIELARSLCEDIEGELEGEVYGSVDVAEILSAEVERLRSQLAEARGDALGEAAQPFVLDCLAGKLTSFDAICGYVSLLERQLAEARKDFDEAVDKAMGHCMKRDEKP